MPLRIAIQADWPQSWKPQTDSTLALALEAQARGHRLYYYHPSQLICDGGQIAAPLCEAQFADRIQDWCQLHPPQLSALSDMDVVLMRQDPPFDMAYLSATYLLELLPPRTRVFNHPAYVRNHPEKLAILRYKEAMPPTLVSADTQAILRFMQVHQKVVMKPLYGFGGHSIFVFDAQDVNVMPFLEQFQLQTREPLMVQAFLPEVKDKDVRALLVNGRVSGAIGRIPLEGSIRANMRVGGKAVPVTLSARQQEICAQVGASLMQGGVLLAGLDFIGDYLTEINITSPTGIRAIQRLYDGLNPAADFWDAVEAG